MKSQNLLVAGLKLLVVSVVALTGVATAQAAPLTDQITVHSQDLNTGVMVVSSVTTAQDGWVVIYKNANLTASEIVGYAPVYQGMNTDVRVSIDTARVANQPTLWAVLQGDNGARGTFQWGINGQPYADAPVMQNGQLVLAAFGTSAPSSVASGTNQLTVNSQDITTGIVVVSSVTAAQDGWIVIYKNPNLMPSEIVGYAPVYQGPNTDVKVTLDKVGLNNPSTLWAVLQADNGTRGVFEWTMDPDKPNADVPMTQNGAIVMAAFGTSAPSPAATGTSQIMIDSQNLNTGVIVVKSVTATQRGWIVIYKNPNLTSSEIVGYAPVYKGTNTDVKVTIDTTKVGDLPTLWAQLQADNGVEGLFEWGLRGLPYNDGPLTQKGQPVVAAFGTSAP